MEADEDPSLQNYKEVVLDSDGGLLFVEPGEYLGCGNVATNTFPSLLQPERMAWSIF